ncbi:DNRLRE domain-containing protein [Sporocytophaga myxococcoides]|uniref:DNRLRE domain-containing protein n=1 Tax=Sporocytophaga myxococcoides TaxID=153721 RepID=UPI0004222358|nr:DNRLRE domain-containing protein [Sporocytophaga myxococcoides]
MSDKSQLGNARPDGSIDTIVVKPGPEGKDAIVSSYFPEENYGNVLSLNAMISNIDRIPYVERAYIDFDLSLIPSGTSILYAELTLYADTVIKTGGYTGHSTSSAGSYGPNEWLVETVTSPWEENTISWFNAPATDVSSKINCASATTFSQSYAINVTESIARQFKYRGSAFGFLIRLRDENGARKISFCSSDYTFPKLRPELKVVYK